jgi:prevent-host-death family protein
MQTISLAEAKARLSELVERASQGESISITRRGKPVARLMPAEAPGKPFDIEALRELRRLSPPQKESAGEFMRRMRDEERY